MKKVDKKLYTLTVSLLLKELVGLLQTTFWFISYKCFAKSMPCPHQWQVPIKPFIPYEKCQDRKCQTILEYMQIKMANMFWILFEWFPLIGLKASVIFRNIFALQSWRQSLVLGLQRILDVLLSNDLTVPLRHMVACILSRANDCNVTKLGLYIQTAIPHWFQVDTKSQDLKVWLRF